LNFRTIEAGRGKGDLLILHSPTERTLTQLQRERSDTFSVELFLRVPLKEVKLDIHVAGGKLGGSIGIAGRNRARILNWRSPIRLDVPGAFSAVGSQDDVRKLADQVVRADLQFRALLDGDTNTVWTEAAFQRERDLREVVRNNLIVSGILDQSFRGNVFSIEKLFSIKDAISPAYALGNEYGDTDELYRAAIVHYANMIVAQETEGPRNPAQLNFDARDVVHFKEPLVGGLFRFIAEMEGIDDKSARSLEIYKQWMARLRGQAASGKPLNLDQWLKYAEPDVGEPFLPQDFKPSEIKKRFAGVPLRSEDYDRFLFKTTHQAFEQLGAIQNLLMLGSIPPLTEGGKSKPSLIAASAPAGSVNTHLGIQKAEALLQIVEQLENLANGGSPPAQDIVFSELKAVKAIARGYSLFMATAKEPSFDTLGLSDDPVAGVMGENPDLLSALSDRGSACDLYDRHFVAHLIAQFLIVIESSNHYGVRDLRLLAYRLWDDYGENQPCSTFLPGVMMLHALLSASGDPRAQRTRALIDADFGADAGWLQDVYQSLGHPELYEGRERYERLVGHTGGRN
jgi:hypothetical protein